ncbi:hypothetical protein BJX63DRAFT_377090 [Aspergillus granulosus]|uniref:Rhodopsin domain-containing protein n=1 Tax=Aspergillus granulosus TaxID=176169 RepID=A0ABR4I4B3_9EURO
MRIFPFRREKTAALIGIVADAVLYAACIGVAIGSLVRCARLERINDAYCRYNSGAQLILTSMIDVVTDFYILILPVPRLLKLQVNRKQKIGSCMTFASGLGLVVLCFTCSNGIADSVGKAPAQRVSPGWVQGRNAQFSYGPDSEMQQWERLKGDRGQGSIMDRER